ncbi:MAG: HXXEE domain-containing protein [Bacillota bacterium]|jgi:hypothetical protein
MTFYRNNWYYIGGIYFVLLTFIIGLWGSSHIDPVRLILIYSFMALLVHQFEEYALPGGFPAIMNTVMKKSEHRPDRYPLNKKSCFLINVPLAYAFYIIAVIFPQAIWLGLAQILFGMLQFIMHGIIVNLKMKSIYNPGLGAVAFLHIPIGIYYMWYVSSQGLFTGGNIAGGIIAALAAAVVLVGLPLLLLADPDSNYPFRKSEMERFNIKQNLQNR